MRLYADILRLPGAWKFSAAGFVARSGGAMMAIGIVMMVSALYDSYGLAGALSAANSVAWAVGTAVLSNLVDRYGQRRVMLPAALVSACFLAALVVIAWLRLPVGWLFAAAIVTGATGGSPGALVRARWNLVVSNQQQLHTAYSLESTFDEVTFIVGPVVVTALATQVHPAAGLICPIILGAVGALLLYSQRATEPLPGAGLPDLGETDGDQVAERSGFLLFFPGMAALVLTACLMGSVFGSIDVTAVAAVTDWGSRSSTGLVMAAMALGSALTGLLYGMRVWSSPLRKRYLFGVIALLAGSCTFLLADRPIILAVCGFITACAIAPTLINTNALVQRIIPSTRLTEGLAWIGTSLGIGSAIGSAVSGQFIDLFGYRAGFFTVITCGTLACLLGLIATRTLRRILG
jgi:MFS family permease